MSYQNQILREHNMNSLPKLTALFVMLGLFVQAPVWASEALTEKTQNDMPQQQAENNEFLPPPPGPYRVLPRREQLARPPMPTANMQNPGPWTGQQPMMPAPHSQAAIPPADFAPPPWSAKPGTDKPTADAQENAGTNEGADTNTKTSEDLNPAWPTMQTRPPFYRPPPVSGPAYGGYGMSPPNWRPPVYQGPPPRSVPNYRGPSRANPNWAGPNRPGQNRPNQNRVNRNWRPPVYQGPPPNRQMPRPDFTRPQGAPPWGVMPPNYRQQQGFRY